VGLTRAARMRRGCGARIKIAFPCLQASGVFLPWYCWDCGIARVGKAERGEAKCRPVAIVVMIAAICSSVIGFAGRMLPKAWKRDESVLELFSIILPRGNLQAMCFRQGSAQDEQTPSFPPLSSCLVERAEDSVC
jgi:hypothetical protein